MVKIIDENVLKVLLTGLRDENTQSGLFRNYLKTAGYLQTYEVINREIPLESREIRTPLSTAEGLFFEGEIVQVIVMRAGLHLASGGARLLDELSIDYNIGIVEATRIEENVDSLDFDIVLSDINIPNVDNKHVIIYDPMIASGNTMKEVLRNVWKKGEPDKIIICSIVSAPYGINNIEREFQDIDIYTLTLDEKGEFEGLNSDGYIVPGLGDCGDRAFGTD